MSVINTNVSALHAQGALNTNSRAMSTAMEQLSTGSRINSARDDAAGLAIGQNMTSQVRGLNQSVRNANDGINMLQTAEGAMVEVSNMLQRMRELAVQASNGTYSTTQRGYLQKEFSALSSQIASINTQTKWNGTAVLSAATTKFQVGAMSGQTVSVIVSATTLVGLGISSATFTLSGATVASGITNASSAITKLDSALGTINAQRANIGAGINRLTYAADNLTNISSNLSASRSTIMDTDYATASTQLSKTQIIQQAATAMLAQANQQPQSVLALLK
ncbi:MAG: flagellin [Burkholderiales bacterium]|nr:flagellin [Burkholderiales bacterium]